MWRPDRFKYLHQVAQFVGRALNWQEIPGGGGGVWVQAWSVPTPKTKSERVLITEGDDDIRGD